MSGAPSLRYVAEPIFDREEKVFGYELLFRNGIENCFSGDKDEASRSTLDSSLLLVDVLCDGRHAFVNCTRDTLIKGLVTLLPPNVTIVEVVETVPADPDILKACQNLKEQGYTIAVDDYVSRGPREALAKIADIIKVEMQLTTEEQRSELIKQLHRGIAGCWRKKSKLTTSSCDLATWGSYIFRVTSSGVLRC